MYTTTRVWAVLKAFSGLRAYIQKHQLSDILAILKVDNPSAKRVKAGRFYHPKRMSHSKYLTNFQEHILIQELPVKGVDLSFPRVVCSLDLLSRIIGRPDIQNE